MDKWEHWLNSLSTRGGNIFVLLLACVGLFLAVIHVLHHADTSVETKTVILSTFSGFSGALLQALVGSSSKQRGSDTNGNGKTPETPKV